MELIYYVVHCTREMCDILGSLGGKTLFIWETLICKLIIGEIYNITLILYVSFTILSRSPKKKENGGS